MRRRVRGRLLLIGRASVLGVAFAGCQSGRLDSVRIEECSSRPVDEMSDDGYAYSEEKAISSEDEPGSLDDLELPAHPKDGSIITEEEIWQGRSDHWNCSSNYWQSKKGRSVPCC